MIDPFGKHAFISDKFGDDEFGELDPSMTLGDLITFVEDARMHGVPLTGQVVDFPAVTVIRQLAVIYRRD